MQTQEQVADDVMRVEEAWPRTKTSRNAFYEAIRRGQIPGIIRIGRCIRISRSAFEAWLAGRGDGAR